jgi:hypothetical protein
MITFIVAVICIFVIRWGKEEYEYQAMGIAIFVLIVDIVFAAWFYSANTPQTEKTVILEEVEIIALKDQSNIDGEIFLGSGHIQENLAYVFMMKTEEGFVSDQVEIDRDNPESVIVVESDFERPRIVKTQKELEPKVAAIVPWLSVEEFDQKTIIYVPVGTVDRSFAIDLN